MESDLTAVDALRRALADRYALERPIGRGGMATVYLAEDRKHERHVAVKVLNPELAASVGAERFLREIRIVARLSHPHILPLIDSGEAGGVLYFVTPYVTGGSLREMLRQQRRLSVPAAQRIVREVGAALDYAHREGFVHRDVKPENILFADGHAVLADFGVARACCVPGMQPVTEVGLAIGTPEYMSPEQAGGEMDLSSSSDLYSLACVLYEMLAGEPPIRGDNARATMMRQVTATPLPLRVRRPDAPQAVEDALARGLAKNPPDRFADVTAFLEALERERTGTDRPIASAAARCIAVLPFVNASPDPENEYLSDGISDELIAALANVEGLRVSSRTSVFALKGKPQDVRAIGALLGAAWVLEGTVRRSGDRLRITAQLSSTDDGRLLWSERYDRTVDDVFAVQDELAQTIVRTLSGTSFAHLTEPVARRYTENVRAYGLYLKGRYAWNKRTQEGVSEAINYFEQAVAEDPRYALAYTGLADSYALQLDYRSVPVAEGFERAKQYARQALALDEGLAEAHASLAWALFIYDWDWEGAGRAFRRAIEINPRYATAHQWYAFLLATKGRHEEALIEGHTALELDPASVSVRRSVGWLYFYARRYEQAIYHLSRAVAMNPTAEESYRMLGLAHALSGDLTTAVRVLRESRELPGAGAYAAAALGYVLARAGVEAEARTLLGELTARAQQEYVSAVAFAVLHLGLGEHVRTLDWIERAREERRGWVAYLTVNPLLDPVHAELRFRELVRSMNLQ
jgi:serine/threonine protein kinase/tetratricopeptide (TPR) repeat protein